MTTTQGIHSSTSWVPDDSTFGARLALIRQRMSWGNVKEAANACGLPVESWRNWERDGVAPRRIVEVASIIAGRTGCDLGWLIAGSRLRDPGATLREIPAASPTSSMYPVSGNSPSRPGPRRPSMLRPPVAV
ncbi:MAG TPA: hypothetical protein VFE14_20850 [Micromonosporaceae bacterium]|nr:hypothetical protein [Micromonosporaceae bacterium]